MRPTLPTDTHTHKTQNTRTWQYARITSHTASAGASVLMACGSWWLCGWTGNKHQCFETPHQNTKSTTPTHLRHAVPQIHQRRLKLHQHRHLQQHSNNQPSVFTPAWTTPGFDPPGTYLGFDRRSEFREVVEKRHVGEFLSHGRQYPGDPGQRGDGERQRPVRLLHPPATTQKRRKNKQQ